jgi:hypothetical protein
MPVLDPWSRRCTSDILLVGSTFAVFALLATGMCFKGRHSTVSRGRNFAFGMVGTAVGSVLGGEVMHFRAFSPS